MTRLLLSTLLLVTLVRGAVAQRPLVIRHARVVDIQSGTVQVDFAVVIAEGRITRVGPDSLVTSPPGTQVIDARGGWLCPGIIDTHSHDGSPIILASALALGVTTLHTMPPAGDTLGALANWAATPAASTPYLIVTPWLFSGMWPDNLFPGTYRVLKPQAPAEAESEIARLATAGVRQVKVYFEDGSLWFEPSAPIPNLTPEVTAALVHAAHIRGMRVYAHAWRARFAREAVALGVDAVLHPIADSIMPPAYWNELRGRDLPWISTNSVLVGFGDPADYARRVLADFRLRRLLSDNALSQLTKDSASGTCAAAAFPILCREYHRFRDVVNENTRSARRAGVSIAVGSDWTAGVGTHIELELMQEAGIPPVELLRAATYGSARALGVADSVGSIAVGQRADLILVSSDPLADIRNLRSVVVVVKGGRPHDPSDILRSRK